MTREVAGLAGDYFVDFRVADDEFEGDFYAFVKCLEGMGIEAFRRSSSIVAVLESYDNPTYLGDREVADFVSREPAVQCEPCTGVRDGDIVAAGGEGVFSKLNGVVAIAGCDQSLVMFRFHTVTRREWIPNEELIITGNVFSRLKLPVRDTNLFQADGRRYPVIKEEEEEDVDKSERDRGAD